MNKFFRALIAGYGAKKLGGGCLSTIIIFIVIYYALGNCNSTAQSVQHRKNTVEMPAQSATVKQ
jgi:CHASE3 domain sensor protein